MERLPLTLMGVGSRPTISLTSVVYTQVDPISAELWTQIKKHNLQATWILICWVNSTSLANPPSEVKCIPDPTLMLKS